MYSHTTIKGLEELGNQGILWVNLETPKREKMDILSSSFSLHELNIEDCLSKKSAA